MIAIASQPRTERIVYTELASTHDRQIHAAVSAAFAASQYLPLRQLNCRVKGGVVEILGTVSSFYLKQLAQAAVLQLNQAGSIHNLVEVAGQRSSNQNIDCGG